MGVSGYFLIEGLSQFSGGGTAKNMLIIGGVLFQITESLCFIAASALTYHSLRWRYILFSLGVVLFGFSIAVMTLAQKTALQTGEAQAQAIDEKREHIRRQIASLEQVIGTYRLNAEKQSRSIYKDSRALGQDSINRAAEMEERKLRLSEELFALNTSRRQTAADFFQRLQEVSGLPAQSTEFYFLVLRSLLLELSGIILLSFGANLRAYNKLVIQAGARTDLEIKKPLLKKLLGRLQRAAIRGGTGAQPTGAVTPAVTPAVTRPDMAMTAESPAPHSPHSRAPGQPHRHEGSGRPNSRIAGRAQEDDTLPQPSTDNADEDNANDAASGHHLTFLATMVMDLYEQRLLQELNPVAIKDSLSRYCSQKVSNSTAGVLSKLINKRLDETC